MCLVAGALSELREGGAQTLPVLNVGSVSIMEADSGSRTLSVPVTLSAPSAAPVTVSYVVTGMTAIAGQDFTMRWGQLAFPVNATTGLTATEGSISVTVLSDTAAEPTKTLQVRLWNATGATIGTATASSTITDNDPSSTLTVSVGSGEIVRPSAGAPVSVAVPVVLSRPSLTAVSVSYSTLAGTAQPGIDYAAPTTGTISFPPGVVERVFSVRVYPSTRTDGIVMAITLSRPIGATLSASTGLVLIDAANTTAADAAPASIYWGAWFSSTSPWRMTPVTSVEGAVGKRASLIQFSAPFANCAVAPCKYYAFDTNAFNLARNHGSIPFFSWASESIPVSTSEPKFQLSDILAGTYDSYIKQWAASAKAWGHPFFLRFDWEMNGNWFPWSESANGNSAGQYVAAWRHVHDLFQAVGATNATWVWCPNVDPSNTLSPLSGLYPGDAYVDWTCLDGYNWGGTAWETFNGTFATTYEQLVSSIASTKPVVIGEVSSTEKGGSKAAWITDALGTQLPENYPRVSAFLWFNKSGAQAGGMDWNVGSSQTSLSAFANAISNNLYGSNTYGGLNASPILPLR
jgi:hypothetical protein